jgi:hypothetical protein
MRLRRLEQVAENAAQLIVEACELCDRARDAWDHRDHLAFVELMREAAAKHGSVAVLYDVIANECERSMLS